MLYMVGEIFLYGICFNRVYTESDHNNMTNFAYLFFTSSQKNINLLKTAIEGHDTALCCHTHNISIKYYLLNSDY